MLLGQDRTLLSYVLSQVVLCMLQHHYLCYKCCFFVVLFVNGINRATNDYFFSKYSYVVTLGTRISWHLPWFGMLTKHRIVRMSVHPSRLCLLCSNCWTCCCSFYHLWLPSHQPLAIFRWNWIGVSFSFFSIVRLKIKPSRIIWWGCWSTAKTLTLF